LREAAHEGGRSTADMGDVGEILQHVVVGLGRHRGIERLRRGGAEDQRVAVRFGARDAQGADHAGGARLVVDHDRLPQCPAEALAEQAAIDVGRPAGREGHDQAHGLRGPGLGARHERRDQRCREGGGR
jgi:hypothetical protein